MNSMDLKKKIESKKPIELGYDNDLVLASTGGISRGLFDQIKKVLEYQFGLSPIQEALNPDDKNIAPFLDAEPRFKQPRQVVEEIYEGKHVVIVEDLKAYDNRLNHTVGDLTQRLDELDIQDSKLSHIIARLQRCAYNTLEGKSCPRFTSSRLNPSTMANQLFGQVHAAKMGEARHVSVAIPKTVFEWSHHFAEQWDRGNYEIPSFKLFLDQLKNVGADSAVILHPHAPKEGLDISRAIQLNYVMLYPQTYTISSNGWVYAPDRFFEGIDVKSQEFDPMAEIVEEAIEKLGESKNLKEHFIYIAAPDKGATYNAKLAAKRFGLKAVQSLKERYDECESKNLGIEPMTQHLDELKKHTLEGRIKVYILDDKMNSGGTTNEEAYLRRQEIEKYNQENGTNYDVDVEAMITHIRCPDPRVIKHDKLDRIHVFDTVPYIPDLESELRGIGARRKFNIVNYTAHQLAMGIALDYWAQKIHTLEGRDKTTGSLSRNPFREVTDKILVMKRGFGAPFGKRVLEKYI